MMNRFAVALMCLACSVANAAQPAPTRAEKAGVASAVARYVNAIACPGVRITPADVMLLSNGDAGVALPRYAVLWNGDLACFGGTQADKTYLAIATLNTGQYVVQPELSSPVVAFESPVRLVSRIVSYTGRILVLEGQEFGPGDADNAPSVPVRFILRVDGKGNWMLVDKVFLAQPGS